MWLCHTNGTDFSNENEKYANTCNYINVAHKWKKFKEGDGTNANLSNFGKEYSV